MPNTMMLVTKIAAPLPSRHRGLVADLTGEDANVQQDAPTACCRCVIAASSTQVAYLPSRVERVSRSGFSHDQHRQEQQFQRDQRPAGHHGVALRDRQLQRDRGDECEQHRQPAFRVAGPQPRRDVVFGAGGQALGAVHELLDGSEGSGVVVHQPSVCATMERWTTTRLAAFPDRRSRHVSVWIDADPQTRSTSSPRIRAHGAAAADWPTAGLRRSDAGGADAVTVEFAPPNEFGVLDHVVRLPSGEAVYNPLRVIPAGVGRAALRGGVHRAATAGHDGRGVRGRCGGGGRRPGCAAAAAGGLAAATTGTTPRASHTTVPAAAAASTDGAALVVATRDDHQDQQRRPRARPACTPARARRRC